MEAPGPRDVLCILEQDGRLAHEVLDRRAADHPDTVLIYDGERDREITYREFAVRTDAIAGNLARIGVGKGGRVGTLTTDPVESAFWMFGIWKAGAVYCPVNFTFSGRLLAYQINDSTPQLLLCEARLLPEIAAVAHDLQEPPAVVVHDRAEDTMVAAPLLEISVNEFEAPAPAPNVDVAPEDPASIIYTSGTSGPSKGVLQSHRFTNSYTWILRMNVTSADVIYNDLPMYHIGGAYGNFVRGVWQGAKVALYRRFSSSRFWSRIERSGATTAILLDVMIPWMMNTATSSTRVNSLNKVHMQPLPKNHREIATKLGFDFVTCGFGQTESGSILWAVLVETDEGAGTPASLYRGYSHEELRRINDRYGIPVLAGDDERVGRSGFAGKPVPLHEVSVLEKTGVIAVAEDVGELVMRPRLPATTTLGYIGKPEATLAAQRHLWWHTGDAAVMDRDGYFYFVDRLGDRLRVRGENVASFDVEHAIAEYPEVGLCAVFAVPSDVGDEDDIVAYVEPAGELLDMSELRRWIESTLPRFMRPKYLQKIDAMPRTNTNKVEKYRLRERFEVENAQRS